MKEASLTRGLTGGVKNRGENIIIGLLIVVRTVDLSSGRRLQDQEAESFVRSPARFCVRTRARCCSRAEQDGRRRRERTRPRVMYALSDGRRCSLNEMRERDPVTPGRTASIATTATRVRRPRKNIARPTACVVIFTTIGADRIKGPRQLNRHRSVAPIHILN